MTRSVILAAAAAAMLLCLTACAPHPAPTRSAHAAGPTTTPTPTVTPTPTATPLAADLLFEITVTATAPNGAVAHLVEAVHTPVDATDQQSTDEAQLDNECDSWRNAFSPIKYLVGQFSATVSSGIWNPSDVVAADMAGYPVWQGDERPYQAFCATALPSIPGGARAVSPVGGGDADSNGGWGIYRYGFGVPTDPSAGSSTPAPSDVVLSDCTIQLGAAASDSVFASSWPTTPQTDGSSCYFGGSN